MFHVNNLIGFGALALPPVTLINRSTLQTSSSDAENYTFSSVAIGTASPTRRVIVALVAEDGLDTGRTLESATIAGINATIHTQVTHDSGGAAVAAIFSAVVPTGTTANIFVDFDGTGNNMNRCAIYVVAVDGLLFSDAYDTTTDTASPLTNVIDFPGGGYVIGIATTSTNAGFTWSGLTEQADGAYEGAQASVADSFPISDSFDNTITATPGGGSRMAMAVVAFR